MAKLRPFTGYSPKVKTFFNDLSQNNNKEWFDKHRKFYEDQVRDTTKALVADMSIEFADAGIPLIGDPKRSVFRINRDIRFSPNKDPYKTNLGAFFPYKPDQAGKKPIFAVGFYFHIDLNETFAAGGLHSPESAQMKAIRERISQDYDLLEDMINTDIFKSNFPEGLTGEKLKTMPRGFDKDHPAAEYLKMKQFTVWCKFGYDLVQSEKLKHYLVEKAAAMMPLLEFLHSSVNEA